MTTSQFANFKNNSQQLDYLYSTGSTTLSTLDYTVNNGTYYIVISNTGANEANVDFQNCLLNV